MHGLNRFSLSIVLSLVTVTVTDDFVVAEPNAEKPVPVGSAAVTLPLKVSANRRYLVDQQDKPFLIVGDTAWSLIVDLSESDIKMYLDDRSRRGFNSIIVNLIEHQFSTDPPRTKAGIEPFKTSGDFSTPNPAYFDFAREVIELAGGKSCGPTANSSVSGLRICQTLSGWSAATTRCSQSSAGRRSIWLSPSAAPARSS